MSPKDWQVKYTVIGFLLPPLARSVEVTDRLVLKQTKKLERVGNRQVPTVDAYIKVTIEDESKIFKIAKDYLQSFLELFSLKTGLRVRIYKRGVAISLGDSKLGEAKHGDAEMTRMGVLRAEGEKKLWYVSDDMKWVFSRTLPHLECEENQYLRLALSYYHRALLTDKVEESLIDLMIAAEALFYTGQDSHGEEISSRLGKLVASNNEEMESVRERTKRLYSKRSAVVHGGVTSIPTKDIGHLFQDLKVALEKFLLLGRTMQRKKIITMIESQNAGKLLEEALRKSHTDLHSGRIPSLRMEYRPPNLERNTLRPSWIITHNNGMGRAVSVRLAVTTKQGVQTYGPKDVNPGGWWRIPFSNINPLKLDKDGEIIMVEATSKDVLSRSYNWKQKIKVPPISDDLWNRLKQEGKI